MELVNLKLPHIRETELSQDNFLKILSWAFQDGWGQRTFEVKFWDYNLKNFFSDFEKTAINLENVRQTSVQETISKLWFICLCYFLSLLLQNLASLWFRKVFLV